MWPFTIALSLPFGLVGAVLGLWITGYPFGFMAFLGIVSLTGIVVNDAIVLIDFINGMRKEGVDIRGGSLWGPMGNVIIFGLSMATLLTLILIPVMYEILEKKTAQQPI